MTLTKEERERAEAGGLPSEDEIKKRKQEWHDEVKKEVDKLKPVEKNATEKEKQHMESRIDNIYDKGLQDIDTTGKVSDETKQEL